MSPFQHVNKKILDIVLCKERENQILIEPFPKLVNSDHETLMITLYAEMRELPTEFTKK